MMVTRRQLGAASIAVAAPALFSGCTQQAAVAPYEDAVRDLWRHGAVDRGDAAAVKRELVRYATLAPSSHNTQCWRFGIEPQAITVLPDLSRRCPAVDPDDHHLFVSLGCAAENLGLVSGGGWRGRWGEFRGIPVMPTYHPAFLLRSPEFKRPVWEDLQKVMARLAGR